jgi:hypothetical protein
MLDNNNYSINDFAGFRSNIIRIYDNVFSYYIDKLFGYKRYAIFDIDGDAQTASNIPGQLYKLTITGEYETSYKITKTLTLTKTANDTKYYIHFVKVKDKYTEGLFKAANKICIREYNRRNLDYFVNCLDILYSFSIQAAQKKIFDDIMEENTKLLEDVLNMKKQK